MIQYNLNILKALEEARNRKPLLDLDEVEMLIRYKRPGRKPLGGWKGLMIAGIAWVVLISGMYLWSDVLKNSHPSQENNAVSISKQSTPATIDNNSSAQKENQISTQPQEPKNYHTNSIFPIASSLQNNTPSEDQNTSIAKEPDNNNYNRTAFSTESTQAVIPATPNEVFASNAAENSVKTSFTLRGWKLASTDPMDFRYGLDKNEAHDGQASAFISASKTNFRSGWLTQDISADQYAGKRLRMTAWVKCNDPGKKAWAGIFMNVRGIEFKTAGFSNMYDKSAPAPAKGWVKCELVTDVPADAKIISFGLYKVYAGEAWIDDINLEVVGANVPLNFPSNTEAVDTSLAMTDAYKRALSMMVDNPSNLDFETYSQPDVPKDWYIGRESQHYRVYRDAKNHHSGSASVCLQSSGYKSDWNTLLQVCKAGNYLNKRVKLTAWVRTAGLKGHASFLFRVDEYSGTIRPDNMKEQSFTGNNKWHKVEMTLDIPETATSLTYGVLLSEKGEVWMDNISIEEVPVRNAAHYIQHQPVNLGFEE